MKIIDYKPLETKKKYKETIDWIAAVREMMYEQPLGKLKEYADGVELPYGYGSVITSCGFCSTWFQKLFLKEAFEGGPPAAQRLSESMEFDLACLHVMDRYYSTFKERSVPQRDFRETGLILAKSFAVADLAKAVRIAELVIEWLKKGWFGDALSASVAQLMLRIYCGWKEIEFPDFPNSALLATLPECYSTIVDTWRDEETAILQRSLVEACEFHVAESHYDTSKKHFEFFYDFHQLFPAEILAVLRLREHLGLEIPAIPHPLMDLPMAKYRFNGGPFTIEMLEQVKRKADIDLDSR